MFKLLLPIIVSLSLITQTSIKEKEAKQRGIEILSQKSTEVVEKFSPEKEKLLSNSSNNKEEEISNNFEYFVKLGESYFINEDDFPLSSIKVNNKFFHIGENFNTDHSYYDHVNEAIKLQEYIDNGYIGSIAFPLNVTDSKTTFIFGHNPGIASYFANNQDLIKNISVKDVNGNIGNYVLTKSWSQPAYFTTEGEVEKIYNEISFMERILLQYCIEIYGETHYQYLLFEKE